MRRPRPAALLALAGLIALVAAATAQASAGGGSSGYGGGGGGGHGSGEGLFWIFWFLIHLGPGGWIALGIVVALVVMFFAMASIRASYVVRKKRRERRARVTLAAAEAAEDDPVFAVDAVTTAAAALYLDAQAAWDARDRARLQQLVGGDLLVEWQRRLDDFDRRHWHNRVKVHGTPNVEYMGLVNRAGDDDDRVVVRITCRMDDYVEAGGRTVLKQGQTSPTVSVAEWWTLARTKTGWMVVSIESDKEGQHHFDEAIVATPEGDDVTLRDASMIEVAQDDAAPADVKTSEIADLDFAGDARAAALDLSLADARFAPDVLEVAVRRAVAGWAEAIDGKDDPLLKVAAPDVARRLLYPNGGNTRLVVRGPHVRHMRITALDAKNDPARMSVEVEVAGRRYVEDRDTAAVVSGSKDRESKFTEHWTLAIDGPPENPWRIVSVP